MWDCPTMTVRADAKKRVVLPGAKPGDVFDYSEKGNGHFLLVRLTKRPPPKPMSRQQVLDAIKKCGLKPMMSWEELRTWTRETRRRATWDDLRRKVEAAGLYEQGPGAGNKR